MSLLVSTEERGNMSAEDLRGGLFVNATQAAIPKLLNSDDYQERGTALKLFSLAAKYGMRVDLRP